MRRRSVGGTTRPGTAARHRRARRSAERLLLRAPAATAAAATAPLLRVLLRRLRRGPRRWRQAMTGRCGAGLNVPAGAAGRRRVRPAGAATAGSHGAGRGGRPRGACVSGSSRAASIRLARFNHGRRRAAAAARRVASAPRPARRSRPAARDRRGDDERDVGDAGADVAAVMRPQSRALASLQVGIVVGVGSRRATRQALAPGAADVFTGEAGPCRRRLRRRLGRARDFLATFDGGRRLDEHSPRGEGAERSADAPTARRTGAPRLLQSCSTRS